MPCRHKASTIIASYPRLTRRRHAEHVYFLRSPTTTPVQLDIESAEAIPSTMNGINDVNGPNGQQHYKPLEAQSIAQRQQEVWNVCRALKDRNELYGVLTRNSAIAMWGVPDPSMDSARTADGVPVVHVVVQTARNRRKGIPGVVAHVWKGLSEEHICHTQDGIDVLAPEPTWASMAETLSVDMLVELAESQMRHGRTTKENLPFSSREIPFVAVASANWHCCWWNRAVIRPKRPNCDCAYCRMVCLVSLLDTWFREFRLRMGLRSRSISLIRN